ncbi:hypothetical protein [Thalassiella azotivora]
MKLLSAYSKPVAGVVTVAIALTISTASAAVAVSPLPGERPTDPVATSEAVSFTLSEEDLRRGIEAGHAGSTPTDSPGLDLPGDKGQEQTEAVAIPAVAIAAAAWCARGALSSVPTTALSDILAGKKSSFKTYVWNAVIGCLVGEVGGVLWRVVPPWAKQKAIHAVIAMLIRWRS